MAHFSTSPTPNSLRKRRQSKDRLSVMDIAPILRPCETMSLSNISFYSTLDRAWQFFKRPDITNLTRRAVATVTNQFTLFETLEGMIVESLVHKILQIERRQGLAFPKYGMNPSFKWEGWFINVMKNATYDIVGRFILHHHLQIDEEKQDSHPIQLPCTKPNPEETALTRENEEKKEALDKLLIQFVMNAHPRDLSQYRRLCFLLLRHPELVQKSHFMEAGSQFSRNTEEIWTLWQDHLSNFQKIRQSDKKKLSNARAFLTWLLYGCNEMTLLQFQESKVFNKHRDTLRQSINRAQKDIQYALTIHIITHLSVDEMNQHRQLIEHVAKNNHWFGNVNEEVFQKLKEWKLKISELTNSDIHDLAAIMNTEDADYSKWKKNKPQMAQNNTTRLVRLIKRLEGIMK